MDNDRFAEFIRTRRSRLKPSDVGMPGGLRRRTPGLRREEVAMLAAISVDYYTRLEQSRGAHPSRSVLSGLARALRLSDDERSYMFQLAGELPDAPSRPSRDVSAGTHQMLQRLNDIPAIVLDAKFEVIAWNDLAAALLTDFSKLSPTERNFARQIFLYEESPIVVDVAHRQVADLVADLRTTSAHYPDDGDTQELVADLMNGSSLFAQLWENHDVGAQRTMCTVIHHSVVGKLTLCCEVLHIHDRDQRLMLYTAEPGSSSWDALRLLEVVGTQNLDPSPHA